MFVRSSKLPWSAHLDESDVAARPDTEGGADLLLAPRPIPAPRVPAHRAPPDRTPPVPGAADDDASGDDPSGHLVAVLPPTAELRRVTIPVRSAAGRWQDLRRRDWRRGFIAATVVLDLLMCVAAVLPVLVAEPGEGWPAWYLPASAALPLIWVAALAVNRTYEYRFIGLGTEEFLCVLRSGVLLLAIVACVSYAASAPGYLVAVVPAVVVIDLLGRYVLRCGLHRAREQGRYMHRTLLVGSGEATQRTADSLRRDRSHGMKVVGAWVTDGVALADETCATAVAHIAATVRAAGVSVVTVLPCAGLSGIGLRRLAWALEQTHVELIVHPGLVEIARGRVTVHPVAHSAMLHISRTRFAGPARLAKASFDRGSALAGIVLLAPLLVGVAAWITLADRRSPVFRQTRVGRDGRTFTLYKFRTMVPDAEHRKAELAGCNETDGLLFKMRGDPRITPVGRWLRRYSLDELPQLFNVVLGQMSLVGPRPPLPEEVRAYGGDVHRRLLVKPGLTGLWQVSGRSDLSWDESVRLDLRYVENWSLGFDLVILWRTARAVFGRSGAY